MLRGTGPLLLLIAGGDGDAGVSSTLAGHLADRYTVLTYDRRGLSASRISPEAGAPDITTHADDVHHLLAALTSEPAYVCGSSIGALIALEFAGRHPEQVRTLVAHEPPATQLLTEPERERAAAAQSSVEATFAASGALAALREFAVLAGVDPSDREPDVALTPPGPERVPNLEFFLTYDAPAVRRHILDVDALKAARIVPAVGETSGTIFARECAIRLADALGVAYATFPGGHNGSVFRPRAFAACLADVLT
ncbi:alpha/beta fold hydrolase [Nonomuraea sediminis]|uniref:alpha/beta fold hydrolase n=1 Tax=Nonomuraea sediminis TaxID=2835864 RepID=UPI001BDD2E4E|nr:alpha/beta hydrolase [Nonomuraea sediminis]